MTTILLIVLILLLIGGLPVFPHSKSWGYGPSGIIGTVLVVLLILGGCTRLRDWPNRKAMSKPIQHAVYRRSGALVAHSPIASTTILDCAGQVALSRQPRPPDICQAA